MKTIIIAAIARNGVIGNAGGIPWSYPEDMKRFRDVTMGHAVVMGRKTWESLPERFRPLPGRTNCVVSSRVVADGLPHGAHCGAPTLPSALCCPSVIDQERAFIIGGAQLYAAALPLADELDLTLIDKDYAGDVKFPCAAFDPYVDSLRGFQHGDAWFDLVESRQGETPELTFTKWVRR